MRKNAIPVVLCSALVLSACGGGGGGGGAQPPTGPAFSGTVAIGEPLAGVSVFVTPVDGGGGQLTTTDAAGRYSVQFPLPTQGRPFFMVVAESIGVPGTSAMPPMYPRLYSLTNRTGGTVNVTPLTSLLVARVVGHRQGAFIDSSTLPLLGLPMPSDADIATARQQVVDYLQQRTHPNDPTLPAPVNVSAVTDFIGTAFNPVPGDPYDNAIEALGQNLMNGETIEGVEEHLLGRNAAAATLLEILPLQLTADCVAQGTPDPTLPVGRVQISLLPTGQVNIGSYSYALVTGDQVRRSNAPFFDDFWQFVFNGNGGDQLFLRESSERLISVILSRGASAISCTPTAPVVLASRNPGMLAQIRRLNLALNPFPGFTCTGSVFPGVDNGPNSLFIDANGALRVAFGGYALNLPSLGLDMSADIANNAGVLSTRVRTAGFARVFAGGLDSFGVSLNASGDITRVEFGQQRNGGGSISKVCP